MDGAGFVANAYIVGVALFFLPCTYPLLIGYFGLLAQSKTVSLLQKTSAFAIGFIIVYTFIGALAGLFGITATYVLGTHREIIHLIGGIFIISMGVLMLLGSITKGAIYTFKIPRMLRTEITALKSFLIGSLFAFTWTPCIGPVLASILLLASSADSVLYGAYVLAIFSLGIMTPFIVLSYILTKTSKRISLSPTTHKVITIVVGILLIAIGVLLAKDQLGIFTLYGEKIISSVPFFSSILDGIW